MCNVCDEKMMGRRRFLGLAGLGLVAGSLSLAGGSAAWAAGGPKTTLTADQALAKLKEGNAKFVAGPQLCETDLLHAREHVSHGQAPWATIVGCADSRVPPELVFGGLNVGEIFIARNAGNMVDTATMGTIEYGSGVLGVPLIVVLGHQSCGAVAAACDAVTKGAKYPGSIGPMVKEIIPAVKAVKRPPRAWPPAPPPPSHHAFRTASKAPLYWGPPSVWVCIFVLMVSGGKRGDRGCMAGWMAGGDGRSRGKQRRWRATSPCAAAPNSRPPASARQMGVQRPAGTSRQLCRPQNPAGQGRMGGHRRGAAAWELRRGAAARGGL